MKKKPRIRCEVWLALAVLGVCALLWPMYRYLNPHLVSYKNTLGLLAQGRVDDAAITASKVSEQITNRPDLLQDLGAKFLEVGKMD